MKKWDDFEQLVKSVHTEEEFNELKFVSDVISDIIKARIAKGWTQTELAQRTGLKQSAIARLESQSTIPKLDTLYKIANALGIRLFVDDIARTKSSTVEDEDIIRSKRLEDEVKALREIVQTLVLKVDSLINNQNVDGKCVTKMKFTIEEHKPEQDSIIEQIWLDQNQQSQHFSNLIAILYNNSIKNQEFNSVIGSRMYRGFGRPVLGTNHSPLVRRGVLFNDRNEG